MAIFGISLDSVFDTSSGKTFRRVAIDGRSLGLCALLAIVVGCGNSANRDQRAVEADNQSAGVAGNAAVDGGGGNGAVGGIVKALGAQGGAGIGGSAADRPAAGGSAGTHVTVAAFADAGIPHHANASTDAATPPSADASADAFTDGEDNSCTDCCADNLARGTASTTARLVAKLTNSPEGVTVCPNGDVFVALFGFLSDHADIIRVPLDGSEPELWTTLAGREIAGLTCDRKGRIFGAGLDTSEPSFVFMVTAKGDPGTRLPVPSGSAQLISGNGIIAIEGLDGLIVYASDNVANLIARWKETSDGEFEATIAATEVVGANGLSYDPKTQKLYVGGSQENNIVSFDVAPDGSLGAPEVAWTGPDPQGYVDGTAVDENGVVYAAYWSTGNILRTSDNKVLTETVANPASLAFHGGTLLITDFKMLDGSEGGLYAIDLGVCGALTR
jgi:hypothetical protein